MTFEELLHKRLSTDITLENLLTQYALMPAVFYQEAPDDTQANWKNGQQYPRVCYMYNMQANEERKSAGSLTVSVYCVSGVGVMPERIEPEIRRILKDIILCPADASPYCFTWAQTQYFDVNKDQDDTEARGICGCDITFDILEYPSQETTSPDPVEGMNGFIKNQYGKSIVIGLDRLEDIIVTSAERPVFYCHLDSVNRDTETNQVVWMKGVLSVHVLCPDAAIRRKFTMALAQQLSLDGEVILVDKSPMFVERLQVNYKADYLKNGQLIVNVRYGVLRPTYKEKQLMASVGVVR